MKLRHARISDCNQLNPLLSELGYQISEEKLEIQAKIYIESNACALLVAEAKNGTISGLVAGHIFPLIHEAGNVGRIMALIVDSDTQAMGIGTSLLEKLESWFQENNCLRFEVTSGEHREEAHQFYKAKGYVEDKRRFIKQCAT
jgi:GNAT superfamily N-acetyltransferase